MGHITAHCPDIPALLTSDYLHKVSEPGAQFSQKENKQGCGPRQLEFYFNLK